MSYAMEVGKLYKVGFQRQLGNYQWELAEMIATYVGETMHGGEDFSLRPQLGTTTIDKESIWYVEHVPGPATGRSDPQNQKRRSQRVRFLKKEELH